MTRSILTALCLTIPAAGAYSEAADRPGIVLIFADDLGWKDTGFGGSDFHETPHIDRLAREGMVFTSAYASAGNCAPSRACLLSGQYTPRHGVYAVGNTKRGPERLMRMVPVPNRSGLTPENVTVAEALRGAGYATGIFGKWHLGGTDGAEPGEQGFDVVFDSRRPNPNRRRDEPQDPKGIYSLTRAACEFIEKHRERPFFAFVSHHAIHSALEARPETLKKFREKADTAQRDRALYAGCTYDLDDGVGLLLAKLRELDLEKNTLVLFTSDNGATPRSSQEPLRGSKGCYYEGGIRVPMVVRWPAVIRPGSRCDVPVSNVDFYPTFLAAARADPPEGKTLAGADLAPLLRGEPALGRSAIFWHFPGYLNTAVPRGRDPVFRTRPVSVIRRGDWKLHLYHEEWALDGGRDRIATNRAVELYDLSRDIGERNDLAATETARRDELLDDLLEWIEHVGAPLPTERNPAYRPGDD